MSEAETMAQVAAAATAAAAAAVAAGMSPMGRKSSCRHVEEEEVEIMLSDRLVEGCVLLDKSCPACVTPLLKQMDGFEADTSGDNSLKKGKSRESSKSNQTLTPIDGVPFCVACQAHVVTSTDEVDKVETQKHNLKDMVLTALALDDEPLFGCSRTRADRELLKEMDEDAEEQRYELIKPEEWGIDDVSIPSRISKVSSSQRSKSASKSAFSKKSQKKRSSRLDLEVASDGEVEIVRARSSISSTPKIRDSKSSLMTETMLKQKTSIKEPSSDVGKTSDSPYGREPADEDGAVEQNGNERCFQDDDDEKEIIVTPGLVDKTPEASKNDSSASSIAEIDVKKLSSVDHEDLTADIITVNESEDEILSYEEKKAIAAKALGVKMMHGYSLLEKQCPKCSMPLTEYKSIIDCVVCPALEKKAEKVKHRRDKGERERVRVMLENQLHQQRKISHAKKNRFVEKARHLKDVSTHLLTQGAAPANLDISNRPDTTRDTHEEQSIKSLTKVLTCQTESSTILDSPQAGFGTQDGFGTHESVHGDKESSEKEPTKEETSKEESGKDAMKDTSKDHMTATDGMPSLDIETRSLPTKKSVSEHAANSTSSVTMRTSKSAGAVEVQRKFEETKTAVSEKSVPQQSSILEDNPPISKRGPAKRLTDRCRPVRPVMGIVKVTPQPGSQLGSRTVNLTWNSEPNKNTAMSVRSDKPQLDTKQLPIDTDSLSKNQASSEMADSFVTSKNSQHDSQVVDKRQESTTPENSRLHTEQKNVPNEGKVTVMQVTADESHDDITKVSSLHSDSTISTKSRTFHRKITPVPVSAKKRSVGSIVEDNATVALQKLSSETDPRRDRVTKKISVEDEAGETKKATNNIKSSIKSFSGEQSSVSAAAKTQQASNSKPVQETKSNKSSKSLILPIQETSSNKSTKSANASKSKESSTPKLPQSPRSLPLTETTHAGQHQSIEVASNENEDTSHAPVHSRGPAIVTAAVEENMTEERENTEHSSDIVQCNSSEKRDPSVSESNRDTFDLPEKLEITQASLPNERVSVSRNVQSADSVKSMASQKSETESEVSRKKHWDLLRSESRALLARRCIVGWRCVPETCKGAECGDIQLVAKGKTVECVICGGTGTGNDGVYGQLPTDIVKDPVEECLSVLNGDDPLDIAPVPVCRGITDISIEKSSIQALSPTVMSLVATDQSPRTGVSISQLHRDFESKRSAVSQQIAAKLSQGWSLLNLTCPLCVMPLMTDEEGQVEVCLLCGVVGANSNNAAASGRSVATAVTYASSAKSKDSMDDDEGSTSSASKNKAPDQTEGTSDHSGSATSDITDRITRSSMHVRIGTPPRGDPPASQGYNAVHRRHQLEVEGSRMEWMSVSGESYDNNIKVDPEESGHSLTHTPSIVESEENDMVNECVNAEEDKQVHSLVESASDDTSDSQPDEKVLTKSDRIMSTRQRGSEELDDGSALFAVALPKGFNVGEGHAVTDMMNAAKSSDSSLRVDSQSTPSPNSAAYRLPSPGMTEASLPKMSSPSSRVASPGSSQQTCRLGGFNQAKQHSTVPTHAKGRHTRQPSLDSQCSVASTGSSRRRVTPECPAGRPRYARLTALSTPAKHHHHHPVEQATSRASPTDSPILQMAPRPYHRKHPMRSPSSASLSSMVSASSSASSSLALKVPVDKRRMGGASITSVSDSPNFMSCDGPLDDEMMDIVSTLSGTTRSVTSEAIDQLLARIEDTQVELVAAEKEEDGIQKQERLKELLNRLSIAAAAIQELDNGSQFD